MSLPFWYSSFEATLFQDAEPEVRSPTILSLLGVLACSYFPMYTDWELGITDRTIQLAGIGGEGSIEIGTLHTSQGSQIVAIKRLRALSGVLGSGDSSATEKHLAQFSLQLRIASHKLLRRHPNIINMVGLFLDRRIGLASLSVVLEYSSLGSLHAFLCNYRSSISVAQRLDLAAQVAQGLEAIHILEICHGDVKTLNALVFKCDENSWMVKISDFGHSLVSYCYSPHATVEKRPATRLLDAPELRDQKSHMMSIEAALRTDVFSFGLLVWETLKCGDSFFESRWLDANISDIDIDVMDDFLGSLPHNSLLDRSLEYVNSLQLEETLRSRTATVLRNCLQDISGHRKPIASTVGALKGDSFPRDLTFDGKFITPLSAVTWDWTESSSLYDMRQKLKYGGLGIDITDPNSSNFPLELRLSLVAELKCLVNSEDLPLYSRARYAMIVSECHTIGFGAEQNAEDIVHWLSIAAALGLPKAILWSLCIHDRFGLHPPAPTDLSSGKASELLPSVHPALRLITRIHHSNSTAILEYKKRNQSLLKAGTEGLLCKYSFLVWFFHPHYQDAVRPLHLAAWLGADGLIVELLQHCSPSVRSSFGFYATHYACLGGHLSTLKVLLSCGVPISSADFHSITPLHLAILFPPDEIVEAVQLLIDRGASPNARITGPVIWEEHDIHFSDDTVLAWAVKTRYRQLVQCLLPHYSGSPHMRHYFGSAIKNYFHEIAEDILHGFPGLFEGDPNGFSLDLATDRPFGLWIAHGRGGNEAIQETARVLIQSKALTISAGSSILHDLVHTARVEDDFHFIKALVSAIPATDIKTKLSISRGGNILDLALSRYSQNETWRDIIRLLVHCYTLEELQGWRDSTIGVLAKSIRHESMAGTKILLDKGLNINKGCFVSEKPTSPVTWCISCDGSLEMLQFLVDHGADIYDVPHWSPNRSNITALEWLLDGRAQKPYLDFLLKYDYKEEQYAFALRQVLILAVADSNSESPELNRVDRMESLRYLLTHQQIRKHVNWIYEDRKTLIQYAAYSLNLDAVRLLLDAGADGNVHFLFGSRKLTPLQLAYSHARLMNDLDIPSCLGDPKFNHDVVKRRLLEAVSVLTELVTWHKAQNSAHTINFNITSMKELLDYKSDGETTSHAGDDSGRGALSDIHAKVRSNEMINAVVDRDLLVNFSTSWGTASQFISYDLNWRAYPWVLDDVSTDSLGDSPDRIYQLLEGEKGSFGFGLYL